MDNKINSTLPESEASQAVQIDESRRRLGKVGIAAGSGVILTLASRSVLGGWGTCTGSEMMSGNLSRPGEANPCGCSPGYWGNKNGYVTWTDLLGTLVSSSHAPTALFNSVFNNYFVDPNTTLLEAVRKEKAPKIICGKSEGFLKTAAFHAVAALMNASVYGSRYPTPYQSAGAVITAFNNAVTSCTLNAFVSNVDVYNPKSTWCFGEQHSRV